MKIDIHASRIDLTDELREHVERRLRFAVPPLPGARVRVWLADVNGPRGGRDKLCRLLVSAPGLVTLRVEDLAEKETVALDLAAGRLGQRLRRRMRLTRGRSLREIGAPRAL